MRRAKRIGLALTCAAFAVIGVGMAVWDTGSDRLVGLGIFLFFGTGGLAAFAMPLLGRGRAGRPRPRMVTHRGLRVPALVFPVSRAKVRLASVAAAAIAAAGALFAAENLVVGALAVGLFGPVALAGFVGSFRPAYVALSADGVLYRGALGSSFVPWDAIEDVALVEMQGTQYVGVRVSKPSSIEIGRVARWLARGNRALLGLDLAYSALATPEEVLAEALVQCLEHPERRARIIDGAATIRGPNGADPR